MSNFMSNDNATAVLTPYANAIKSKKDIFSKKYQSSNILHNHWYRLFQIGSTTTWNVVHLRILVRAGYAALYEAFLCLRFTPDGIDPNDTYAEVISSRATYKDIKIISVNSSTFGVVVKNLGNDQTVGFEILEYYSEQPTLFIADDPFSDFGTSEPTAFGSHRYLTGSYNDLLDKPTLGNLAFKSTNASTSNYLRGDGTWVTPPNDNTTYTFATGDNNGEIKVTPSGGSAQNVSVKGLGSAAYTNTSTYALNKALTNEDLNSVTWPGFYNAGGGNTVTNKPAGIDAFGLEVIKAAAGSYYLQRLTGSNSITTYRRKCNGGTWDAWIEEKITDTNDKVRQWDTSGNKDYRVIFSCNDNDTSEVEAVRKNTNFKFNPSTGNLQATQLNGVTIGSSPKFTDTNNRKSFYGTCDTAAATADKVVTLANTDGWELKAGTIVGVKFTNTNTATNCTININGTGAKNVYYGTGVNSDTNYAFGSANRISYFMYDGTYWVWMSYSSIVNDSTWQENTTANSDFRVMLSGNPNDTSQISGAKKNTNFKYNPSTQNLMVPKINGVSTVYTSAVSAVVGDTTCTITNSAITTTSIIEEFCENTSGTKIAVTQVDVTTGQAVLHFAALTEATSFKLRITNI